MGNIEAQAGLEDQPTLRRGPAPTHTRTAIIDEALKDFLRHGPFLDRVARSATKRSSGHAASNTTRLRMGLGVEQLHNAVCVRLTNEPDHLTRTGAAVVGVLDGLTRSDPTQWDGSVRAAARDVFKSALRVLDDEGQRFAGLRGRVALWSMRQTPEVTRILQATYGADLSKVAAKYGDVVAHFGLRWRKDRSLDEFVEVVSCTFDGMLLRAAIAKSRERERWASRFEQFVLDQIDLFTVRDAGSDAR